MSRGAYDENAIAPFRGANGKLKQYRRLARSRTTRYEEAAFVLALLLLVVQGYSLRHRAECLLLLGRPSASRVLCTADGVPLLAQHLILRVVAAIAHAE